MKMGREQLLAATVGTRVPLNGPIRLEAYDSSWPRQFAEVAASIRAVLADAAIAVEHVGSTAVPGLTAKPIIDILLVVADSSTEAGYLPQLEEAGFTLRIREPDWQQHRLFKPPSDNKTIDANVHVFSKGCAEIERMVTFRDWLRADPVDFSLYARTKTDLAARTWEYTQDYADAKSDVVETILKRALRHPHKRKIGE